MPPRNFGHPGRGQGPLGGQPPPDQGVEDAQGQLEVVTPGGADVGQGPDRLLGQVLVGPLAEDDQVAGGQGGGEQRDDHVLPLPVVHREPAVPAGVGPGGGQGGRERLDGGRVELAGQQPVVGEPGDGLVGGQPGAGGQPVEPHPGPPLGGVAQVVAVAEAEAALVGGDPGVPAHLALDRRVAQLRQLGGAGPAGGQVAVGHLGRPQLLEQVGGGGRGHPGGLAQVEQQPARVGGRLLAGLVAAPDRALGDPPAVEQPPAGPEPVGDPAGQPDLPGARVAGDRLGGQQLLVQEPGQHLGHQGPPGPVPAVAGEDGAGLRVGVHVSRLRSR